MSQASETADAIRYLEQEQASRGKLVITVRADRVFVTTLDGANGQAPTERSFEHVLSSMLIHYRKRAYRAPQRAQPMRCCRVLPCRRSPPSAFVSPIHSATSDHLPWP